MLRTRLLVSIAGLVLTACATQTPEQEMGVETETAELTEEAVLAAQRAGYTLVTRNGEQVFCRQDAQTGTRLQRTTICLTASEWARLRRSTRQTLQDVSRGHQPACPPEGTC